MIRPSYLGASKKKTGTKSAKGAKGSIFNPGGTSAQLWMRNPDKRKVDISGLFSPEDTIIAVARGMHPGVLRDMDDRATIRGGLTVLKAAGIPGYTKVNLVPLKSTTANLAKDDAALVRAARLPLGTTIRSAASSMRATVHKHRLDRAAWGARQLYVLDNIKGFSAGHALASAVVALVPIPGARIIGAAMAAHGAISGAIAKGVTAAAMNDMKLGLAAVKAKKTSAKATTKTYSVAKKRAPTTYKVAKPSIRTYTATSKAPPPKSATQRAREVVEDSDETPGVTAVPTAPGSASREEDDAPSNSNAGASSGAAGAEPPWWENPWVIAGGVVAAAAAAFMAANHRTKPGASRARAAVAAPPANRISLRSKP